MKSKKVLQWLVDNLEWDGYGFWLPEICVRVGDYRQPENTPNPTVADLKKVIKERMEE